MLFLPQSSKWLYRKPRRWGGLGTLPTGDREGVTGNGESPTRPNLVPPSTVSTVTRTHPNTSKPIYSPVYGSKRCKSKEYHWVRIPTDRVEEHSPGTTSDRTKGSTSKVRVYEPCRRSFPPQVPRTKWEYRLRVEKVLVSKICWIETTLKKKKKIQLINHFNTLFVSELHPLNILCVSFTYLLF